MIGFKPLSFPKDEGEHKAVIEWWYFNGSLKDSRGKESVFMYCFFKADPSRINLKLPFLKEFSGRDFYFSHSMISDVGKKTFSPAIYIYPELDKESFKKKDIFIKAKDEFIFEKTGKNFYRLKTPELDLDLVSKKEPLLVDGCGWLDLKLKDTYYYSFTDLEAKGKLKKNNGEVSVSGKVWMDRQWSDGGYHAEDKWNWFSVQLENGMEILFFEYGDKNKIKSATICFADGKQFSTRNVSYKPLGEKWHSSETGAEYNISWLIELPEVGIKIKTKAKNKKQEIIFGNINYWEGGLDIEADIGGKKIKGTGFMELVGVPMKEHLAKIYLEKAKSEIHKKGVWPLAKDYAKRGKDFIFDNFFRP